MAADHGSTHEAARCDPRFAALIEATGVEELSPSWLERTPDTVVGLWPDLVIACLNPAWLRFAQANGAPADFEGRWTVGRSLLDAIPPLLRAHYADAYASCLRSREPWYDDYECSTPERFRLFRATVFPLGDADGLLVVHSLRVERLHDREVTVPTSLEPFVSPAGIVVQCVYCRRFESFDEPRWLWVPAWLNAPPAPVSHGICEPCAGYHFGAA